MIVERQAKYDHCISLMPTLQNISEGLVSTRWNFERTHECL